MRTGLAPVIGLVLTLAAATACAPAAVSPTNSSSPSTTTQTHPTPAGPPSATWTSAPLASASAALPTPPTIAIPTSTPAPPTPVIPAGLYITSLDIVPDPPTRGSALLFYATFANTTGAPQTFRWIVYIYRPDNPNTSFGETTVTLSSLALGAHTEQSLGFWRLPLGGPCENFIARVAWMDQNNKTTSFRTPNGKTYEKPFTVCAPADLPSATPPPPSPPTPIATPPPGLFVTDLRTDPNPPTLGSNLVFYPSFSNTTNTVQNYRWAIYIFQADDPTHRIGETSVLQTAFPVGVSEQQSLGSWKAPVVGPCQDFAAQVVWLDQNNKANPFIQPDGRSFEKKLTICPP
jgi:hypothetical protein